MTENYYVNPANIHVCFPIKIRKKLNNNSGTDGGLITVNNFFAHWLKEISITKYGSDKELPPTFSPWEVYQFSDQMLKHLPSDALKTLQKTHLYSKRPVYFVGELYDRRNLNSAGVTLIGLNAAQQLERKKQHAKDLNIDERISLFQNQLKKEFFYRIPLRYFSDTGKIIFPTKIDYRIKIFLETDMDKLFESRKVLGANSAIPEVDAEIIFTRLHLSNMNKFY